jgi:site-specific DNA recombinase
MGTRRRAIGIVRVSRVNGREGESFASPGEQRERIEAACARDSLALLDVFEEMDVSGGTALEDRSGLRSAIEAVENGTADVICAAYFDRLVRSLKVQDELVSRVEAAGGQVLAVDIGRLTNGSASQWLSGTMLGAVAEYQRRTTGERAYEAQARAVARGVWPAPVPPGYRRGEDGVLLVEPREAQAVADAFALRAGGATVKQVRSLLAERGIARSFHGVQNLLKSTVVLGEIRHGKLENLHAHPPIVDRDVWGAVQRMKATRGRKAKSDRLLARTRILRCGTCGQVMSVGSAHQGGKRSYWTYRCSPTSDCPNRMAISATIAESVVEAHVRETLAGVEGHASAEENIRHAEQELAQAQERLEGALRAFEGFDEPAARERLLELRAARDEAQAQRDQVGGGAGVTIDANADWDRLTLDERRALIRATIDRAVVGPGRGPERITITPL